MNKSKSKKKNSKKKKTTAKKSTKNKKIDREKFPTLKLKNENDIAMDFAIKVYKKFDKLIKSIVLFGSATKQNMSTGSDIDIVIIIDDVSVEWNSELIVWYREELNKILKANPYEQSLHINTIKLSTWWEDLMRGDPVLLNILRYGEAMIDMAGFFNPLKKLLLEGKIKPTPEAIYNCLQRAPFHINRSKIAELNSIEGLYWAMVDSAHAALIAARQFPPSPEHIPIELKNNFVNKGKLKMKYVMDYRDILVLHKKISHGEIKELRGIEIDKWQEKTEEFLKVMVGLVKDIVGT
jgi:predicted nucleotidyltransferase